MPKIKAPRTAPDLDMTPMVDLAFLLVTFFILTAKFRADEAVPIIIPSSISDKLLPDNVMMVSIDTAGRVFYSIEGQETRRAMLLEMGKKHKMEFTEKETKTFELLSMFGVDIQNMKQYLGANEEERTKIDQTETKGIPVDSLNNQLTDWINFGYNVKAKKEQVDKVPPDKRLRIAVKADGGANYAKVRKVIKIFQDNNINRFNLITNLEKEGV